MAISKNLLNEGESLVVDTRTHPKALLLPILALVVLLAIGVGVQKAVDESVVTKIVWALVAVGAIWFFVRPVLIWLTATYTITTRRLITRHGVITRRGHDIPLTRISDVAYEKDLIDRLLGCGTLVISDASTHGQVALPDIPRVEDVQRKLNDLLHDLHTEAPTAATKVSDLPDGTVSRQLRTNPRRTSSSTSSARPAIYTAAELAAETGVDLEKARRLWRALGFPEHGAAKAFTRSDAEALSTLVGLVDSGLIDFDLAVHLTRAVGQTMARLSDWEVSALLTRVLEMAREESGETDERLAIGLRMIEEFSEPFEALLVYVWRRHLAAAVARQRGARRARGGRAHDPADRRASRTSCSSPPCPTSSPRSGSATWSSCSRPAAPTSSPPSAAG